MTKQNDRENIAGGQDSTEAQSGADVVSYHEVLRRNVRAADRVLYMEDTIAPFAQFNHEVGVRSDDVLDADSELQ